VAGNTTPAVLGVFPVSYSDVVEPFSRLFIANFHGIPVALESDVESNRLGQPLRRSAGATTSPPVACHKAAGSVFGPPCLVMYAA
jgi:hypothetical protein